MDVEYDKVLVVVAVNFVFPLSHRVLSFSHLRLAVTTAAGSRKLIRPTFGLRVNFLTCHKCVCFGAVLIDHLDKK